MAGAGSCFDRNDYRLIENLTREIGRLADAMERANTCCENPDFVDVDDHQQCLTCGAFIMPDGEVKYEW